MKLKFRGGRNKDNVLLTDRIFLRPQAEVFFFPGERLHGKKRFNRVVVKVVNFQKINLDFFEKKTEKEKSIEKPSQSTELRDYLINVFPQPYRYEYNPFS